MGRGVTFFDISDELRKKEIEAEIRRDKEELRRQRERISIELRKPLVMGKVRKGKKLRVSGEQGARGLVGLI
ncbi:hypothetical protein LCGC14_2167540 [marine sediment metagenome]|uniref:Uncharacterized protein n=1 Tax=marine sediment metagenome TaxID=412755 RepID=A0A0F9G3M8_9ZZZZ